MPIELGKVHNPGSPEAVARGCTCPQSDNYYGEGFPYGGHICFWRTGDCPYHDGVKEKLSEENESSSK